MATTICSLYPPNTGDIRWANGRFPSHATIRLATLWVKSAKPVFRLFQWSRANTTS